VAILLLYSVKAISRNQVWKNNTTLFLTDAKTSSNSAKVQMTAGFELTALVDKNFDSLRRDGSLQEITDLLDMNVNVASLADTSLKRLLLERAMKYLDTSLKIYPTRATAWLQLGNTAYKLHNNLSEAVAYFDSAEVYGSGANYDAWYNMGTLQLNNNQPMQARESLLKAIVLKPDEFVCRFNLALAYFNLNRPDSALYWFSKALENRPQDALTNFAIGTIYGKQLNNPDMAIRYLSTAIQYNPNIPGYYYDLYTAYDKKNMEDDAIRVSQQCLQKYPNDATSIMNIANAYNKKGDPKTAQEYTARLMQQGGHK
jgi:tetratricopeptide (TPR) repeat protein